MLEKVVRTNIQVSNKCKPVDSNDQVKLKLKYICVFFCFLFFFCFFFAYHYNVVESHSYIFEENELFKILTVFVNYVLLDIGLHFKQFPWQYIYLIK